TLLAGLHPTIAGMAAGLLVAAYAPTRAQVDEAASRPPAFRQSPLASVARDATRSVERALSPNERMQELLHPWTSYVIVPLFARPKSGVDLRGGPLRDALRSRLARAIVAGLVGGKTIGLAAGALGAVRARLGKLPEGVGEGRVVGGAALSGIGFPLSLL